MTRILHVALRDFVATVATKGFIFGLLVMPTILGAFVIVGPRIFDDDAYRIEGDYAVIDPTSIVLPELRAALDPEAVARRRLAEFRRSLGEAPEMVRSMAEAASTESIDEALGSAPGVRLVALPADADVEAAKSWLNEETEGPRHTALIVIHGHAVQAADPGGELGAYDLYVPPGLDDRDLSFIHRNVRDAIVDARIAARSLDRAAIDALLRVPRQASTTVSPDGERETVRGFNFILPVAFMGLLIMGIMAGGQTMLTSTIEEKSTRVVEVLLSAVSPMELMAGKLLGAVAISLLMIGLYLGIGLVALSSFSMFGLLDPWLILYLLIFFLIGFFVIGSLMLAVGAAVNDMTEAQSLQMPLMLVVMLPWFIWPAVSRNPDSALAVTVSHLPPVNTFGMILRMASSQPPPWWEVWLSIGTGLLSVVAAVWVAAKVFRIGLLMYGKPPDFRTLIRWIRAA